MEGSAKPYYLKNRQYKKLYEKQTLSIKIWLLETTFTPTFLAILRSIDVINKFLNKKTFSTSSLHFLTSDFPISVFQATRSTKVHISWKGCFSVAHYWQNYDMLNLVFFHVLSDLQWRSEAVKKTGGRLYFHFQKNKTALKSSRWWTDKIR